MRNVPLLRFLLISLSIVKDALAFGPTLAEDSRRLFLCRILGSVSLIGHPWEAGAIIKDETNTFFDTWWANDETQGPPDGSVEEESRRIQSSVDASDEVVIQVSKDVLKSSGGLGIELGEVEFRTNLRVFVKSVNPDSLASRLGIEKNWIFVSLNDLSVERTNAEGVPLILAGILKDRSTDQIRMKFRVPGFFRQRLSQLSEGESVTTQVAPAGDTTLRNLDGSIRGGGSPRTSQLDQKITVTQLVAPSRCNRGAKVEDLLEISYVGRVLETGQMFDGSAITLNGDGIPGRGNDVTLYFVLGKQPFGQFPPGWDTGLYGMCIGERRRLIIPPVLAYGAVGVSRRGIPPDATLQYDITLVSVNGLSTP